jgi:hypothetical protein
MHSNINGIVSSKDAEYSPEQFLDEKFPEIESINIENVVIGRSHRNWNTKIIRISLLFLD